MNRGEEEQGAAVEEEEDEDDGVHMTKKAIVESCRKHDGYIVPEINDTLYLHYEGYPRIKNLEEYVNLKVLWLNNNQITRIENISHLTQLTALYLQNNLITEITGLETLTNLSTLILSHNYIEKIQGLSTLTKLETLEIDHNSVKTPELLSGILECPSIKILNITFNHLEDGEGVLDVLAKMPNLRVLRMTSNPFMKTMRNYNRIVPLRLQHITYLDDTPITETDRRLLAAWERGGKEAERDERQKIKQEKRVVEEKALDELRELQREQALKDGQSLEDHPELMAPHEAPEAVHITPEEAEWIRNEGLSKDEDVD